MSPPYKFALPSLQASPPEHGVYALWNHEVMVYIGHAAEAHHSINSMLMEHYLCQRHPSDATHFSWEICREAAARAAELLRTYEAANQKLPCWNDAAT